MESNVPPHSQGWFEVEKRLWSQSKWMWWLGHIALMIDGLVEWQSDWLYEIEWLIDWLFADKSWMTWMVLCNAREWTLGASQVGMSTIPVGRHRMKQLGIYIDVMMQSLHPICRWIFTFLLVVKTSLRSNPGMAGWSEWPSSSLLLALGSREEVALPALLFCACLFEAPILCTNTVLLVVLVLVANSVINKCQPEWKY